MPLESNAAPIRYAEVREVVLPLLRPFVTGFGITDSRHTVLVHLEDENGAEGWGEAAALDHPYYLPDTTSGTFSTIVEYALPLALAAGSLDPAIVAAAMSPIRGNTFARAGVEHAFWSLAGAAAGTSLHAMLGGVRDAVPVGESLSITESLAETLDEVALRLEQGYQRIKLKIQPGWDTDVVAAVRAMVGDAVMLQVDANAAYTPADADHLAELD
ncbi:MAG TPA: enolase C-terminal domain-like protein, partial [Jatrophihabitans sp.]|nr:enolase C-terminal domain-like protein [Jatrophihabitans sp.]